ncbi:hypothetical protein AXK12_05310 [Cephaloticoccus capnophilus]|uniref:MFS transporter n=1 Tax=Cephaloticoccus capnophilus TaxID=1548208 RepID=A0A139SLL9_9BACT|nr:MFS transporter [Cephaloticoccus capnophilus]KXU35390.1 hypothetical protein AXK12_05310 [Cephaloticoccus capnophilus]
MKTLLRDFRIRRLIIANILSSMGVGITLITIPWLIVQREGGAELYGWNNIAATIVLLIFAPYYGSWLDKHSRKTALVAGEAFGALTAAAMTAWILATGVSENWQLLLLFFCGVLYYSLHFPAKFAFIQQVFDRRHYQSLLGLMEVQGQIATMLAGGLASVLIDRLPFGLILLFNAATYAASFFILRTLPYRATHLAADDSANHDHPDPTTAAPTPPESPVMSFITGLRWMMGERLAFSVFLICTLAPFIAVMVGGYMFPVYVQTVLEASASVYGRGEVALAIGAILAGLALPRLITGHSQAGLAIGLMGLFLAGLGLLSLVPGTGAFYVALLMLGLGNAGARVVRGSVMLHSVPNALMGRVNVVMATAERLIRTLLMLGAIALISRGLSPTLGFAGLILFMLLSVGLAWATRRAVSPAQS